MSGRKRRRAQRRRPEPLAMRPSKAVCSYELDDLLREVTDENRHEETDWGPPVGKEVW